MEPDANAMFEEMKSKKGPVGIDESPITVPDRTGQIWLAADEDTALVKVAASRAEAVLREIFPFFERPLTADGYRPYMNLFKTLQAAGRTSAASPRARSGSPRRDPASPRRTAATRRRGTTT